MLGRAGRRKRWPRSGRQVESGQPVTGPEEPGEPKPDLDASSLDAMLAADEDARREFEEALKRSPEFRRLFAPNSTTDPTGSDGRPPPPIDPATGRKLAGVDPLGRWRRTRPASLVIVGDSIACQFAPPLREALAEAVPGGWSFGYAGLAGGVHAGWVRAGPWTPVGTGGSNLGLPATAAAAVRSSGDPTAILTWTRPTRWAADRVDLHWVDDRSSGAGFSLRVDRGPWRTIPCERPDRPTLVTTPIGPINSVLEVRAANAAGAAEPSPVFLGIDVRDDAAANVVHPLTYLGGRIAGRDGDDSDACLRPERVDTALAHLSRFDPTLVLWESINDAVALDLDRLDAAVAAVEDALPDADHAAVAVYEVDRASPHDAGQDALHAFVRDRFDALVDFRPRWGSAEDAIAAGLLAEDGIHPTHLGGAVDLARALSALLAPDG